MRLNQKGIIDWLVIFLVVVFIAGGFLAYQLFKDDQESDKDAPHDPEFSERAEADAGSDTSTPVAEAPKNQETAKLLAVGDYTGMGDATRSTDDGYFHSVIAQLDDPAEGKFYEGWIVGPSIVSTGMLEKEDGNTWTLVFTSDSDYSEHDRVVITEETLADGLDGNPEDHVLEGSF